MPKKIPIDELFDGSFVVAWQGAAINAKNEPRLVPTIFFILSDHTIKLVGWDSDKQPYDPESVGYIREMAKEFDAVGIVFVAETSVGISGPEPAMGDGVFIYGYLRRPSPRSRAMTYMLTGERALIPTQMNIPERVTRWLKAALDY